MEESHLRELIEEATIDCYGEDEEFWGSWKHWKIYRSLFKLRYSAIPLRSQG